MEFIHFLSLEKIFVNFDFAFLKVEINDRINLTNGRGTLIE